MRRVYSPAHRVAARWIRKTLPSTREHLTPELALRLITPEIPLFMARPEECPFPDPYWGFFWPGGQALARHLLDAPEEVKGQRVAEIGCGCGAVSVAALAAAPASLLVNDIDEVALAAACVNLQENGVARKGRLRLSSADLTGADSGLCGSALDLLLLGDMFYDDEFAAHIQGWLQRLLKQNPRLRILIGDPGRHALRHLEKNISSLAEYPLPPTVQSEHYGSSSVKVYQYDVET